MRKYVVGFAFDTKSDNVLLIEKQSPDWQKGLINGIGGKVKESESADIAMSREFNEECGISTCPADWKFFCDCKGVGIDGEWQVGYFSIELDLSSAVQMEKERLVEHPWNDLPHNVIGNLIWIIPMAKMSKDIIMAKVWEV